MSKNLQIPRTFLMQQPLLQHFNDAEFDQILPTLKFLHPAKSETIIHQGQLSGGIFIILKGKLKVVSTDFDDKQTGLAYLNASQFFGELSVIEQTPSNASVETVMESLLLLIPTDICLQLINQKPAFTMTLLKKLANSLRATNNRFMLLQASGEQRLIYYFKSVADENLADKVSGPLLKHEEIAGMTNLSRETVSRMISNLRKTGKLETFKSDAGKRFTLFT